MSGLLSIGGSYINPRNVCEIKHSVIAQRLRITFTGGETTDYRVSDVNEAKEIIRRISVALKEDNK